MFSCLRGSSEDDSRRSVQSTPRLGRSCGSDSGGTRARRDRSYDSERTVQVTTKNAGCVGAAGLDRSWEAERLRGLELLQMSMEREKLRRGQKQQQQQQELPLVMTPQVRPAVKTRQRRRQRKRDMNCADIHTADGAKLCVERFERRIAELSSQLLEEKQQARRDKLTVVRLQREIARQKSDGPLRETLMKELERERLLRLDAEQRLRDVMKQNETTHTHHIALQEELKKLEQTKRSAMQYKSKLDHLKQEKAMLTVTYEASQQRFRTHISNLEEENKLLTAEVYKLESQGSIKGLSYRVLKLDGERVSSTDSTSSVTDSDKCRVLLERLKMLDSEKSALVLENEAQRTHYERCLDEIAGQVIEALLAQKSLRQECAKLQQRVTDLEAQNRQLHVMFQQKVGCIADPLLQASQMQQLSEKNPFDVCESAVDVDFSHGAALSDISLGSLRSMCSNYHENLSYDAPGAAALSSPPSWLSPLPTPPSEDSPVRTSQPITCAFGCECVPAETRLQTEFPPTFGIKPKMTFVSVTPSLQHTASQADSGSAAGLVQKMCYEKVISDEVQQRLAIDSDSSDSTFDMSVRASTLSLSDLLERQLDKSTNMPLDNGVFETIQQGAPEFCDEPLRVNDYSTGSDDDDDDIAQRVSSREAANQGHYECCTTVSASHDSRLVQSTDTTHSTVHNVMTMSRDDGYSSNSAASVSQLTPDGTTTIISDTFSEAVCQPMTDIVAPQISFSAFTENTSQCSSVTPQTMTLSHSDTCLFKYKRVNSKFSRSECSLPLSRFADLPHSSHQHHCILNGSSQNIMSGDVISIKCNQIEWKDKRNEEEIIGERSCAEGAEQNSMHRHGDEIRCKLDCNDCDSEPEDVPVVDYVKLWQQRIAAGTALLKPATSVTSTKPVDGLGTANSGTDNYKEWNGCSESHNSRDCQRVSKSLAAISSDDFQQAYRAACHRTTLPLKYLTESKSVDDVYHRSGRAASKYRPAVPPRKFSRKTLLQQRLIDSGHMVPTGHQEQLTANRKQANNQHLFVKAQRTGRKDDCHSDHTTDKTKSAFMLSSDDSRKAGIDDTAHLSGCKKDKKKIEKRRKVLTCCESSRPRIHRDEIFVRYASPERLAIASFSFLDRWPSEPVVSAAGEKRLL